MNLVISKCVTAVKVSNVTGDYLPNRSTLDIGVLGFFGIVSHKEHPPEVWSLPPVTPCICKSFNAVASKFLDTRCKLRQKCFIVKLYINHTLSLMYIPQITTPCRQQYRYWGTHNYFKLFLKNPK